MCVRSIRRGVCVCECVRSVHMKGCVCVCVSEFAMKVSASGEKGKVSSVPAPDEEHMFRS